MFGFLVLGLGVLICFYSLPWDDCKDDGEAVEPCSGEEVEEGEG